MLMEEFGRVGLELDMSKRRIIDAMQVFYKMEPRTLKAALKFYCGQELTDAHDAMADTKATAEVIWGQIQKYDGVDHEDGDGNITPAPIKNDMQSIHEFINDKKTVDYIGRFKRNDAGNIVFNFGSNRGEEAYKHPNTLKWIISKDFPMQVKQIAQAILDGKMK
jgi:DNA polymerase-3 subunit epsilon